MSRSDVNSQSDLEMESNNHKQKFKLNNSWIKCSKVYERSNQTSADKESESPDSSVLSLPDTGHDFPENPDKTRQGQDTDSAVRRRLVIIRHGTPLWTK